MNFKRNISYFGFGTRVGIIINIQKKNRTINKKLKIPDFLLIWEPFNMRTTIIV